MSPRKRATARREQIIAEASASDFSDEDVKKAPQPKPKETTLKKILVRAGMGCLMVAYYLGMLRGGHMYCILTGVLTQAELFRELVNVRYRRAQEKSMPLFRTIQWTWFVLSMAIIYGDSFHKFCMQNKNFVHLTKITQYFDAMAFAGYCILFMITVLTLKQGLMKFQLSQLMWTVATLLLVVGQCKFLATCVLTGMFWFFFPMATVVMNDVAAYFCGITMGRKIINAPFLAISPNKTWEGFIGGGLLTILFSFFFPVLLSQYTWFICPAEELSFIPPAHPSLTCDINPVFLPREYELPAAIAGGSGVFVTLLPIQLHGLMYGLFASIVAPFGGFMASAIKRAYDIKDFDSFFPGHGGMMDRMDCQLLMLLFTWVHMFTFVIPRVPTIRNLLLSASMMSIEDQMLLHEQLGEQVQGLIAAGMGAQ